MIISKIFLLWFKSQMIKLSSMGSACVLTVIDVFGIILLVYS